MFSNLRADVQFALRSMRKSPVFTSVVILSFALGIGANTAIFTLVDRVLLRMLPVKEPERLVALAGRGDHYGSNQGRNALSYPMYLDFVRENQVFDGLLARQDMVFSVVSGGSTERVPGELVSGNYFEVLGVGAALGRVFTAADNVTPSGHPWAVLSYDYWQTRFAANPSVIGQTIRVNNYPLTVIGVSEKGFEGIDPGFSHHIRVPLMMNAQMKPVWNTIDNRRTRWVNVFGRLKPGVSVEQAQAGMQPLFKQILKMEVEAKEFAKASQYARDRFLAMTLEAMPAARGRGSLERQFSRPLVVLMSIVGLVLLVACSNVAGLLIARGSTRRKEIAIRLAMGAGRGRLIAQLLTESALLALFGGIAALGVSAAMARMLVAYLPSSYTPAHLETAPDWRILAFNFGVALATGLVFGLLPAMQATRTDLARTLKEQGASLAGGGGQVRLRKLLVAGEVGLSLLLLIGAGLFVRSLLNLRTLNPGFRTENLAQFMIDPQLNGYSEVQTRAFTEGMLEKLRATPGVRGAATAWVPVLYGWEWDNGITVEGYQAKDGENMSPYFNAVSPGYFSTMGIRLLEGRDFSEADGKDAPRMAVVNDRLARHYFGSQSAIGRRFGQGRNPGTKTDITIVGVIENTKYVNLREPVERQVYLPQRQRDATAVVVYVRSAIPPEALFTAIRRVAAEQDATVPVFELRTVAAQMDQSLIRERLVASLSAAFGVLATVLAVVGLYGVMAYSVARRGREIAIRMALGAVRGSVLWLVMKEVLVLVAAGTALGLPAAWALARLVEAQLYGVAGRDPLTVAGATATLALVALAAGYLPARRAASVDPMRALRDE